MRRKMLYNDGAEAGQGDAERCNVGALTGHTKLTFWWLPDRNLNDILKLETLSCINWGWYGQPMINAA
jgi:hypothetical protein